MMGQPANMKYLEGLVSFLNVSIGLYCQPEEDEEYRYNLIGNLKKSCQILLPDNLGRVEEMEKYVKETSFEKMLVEYTRIFLGPFKAIAHPYSSVYLGDGTLNGPSTLWVKEYYALSGFEFNKDIKDLPDHIAVEWEYLYTLKYNQIEALRNENQEEAEKYSKHYNYFFKHHFSVWVPKFCEKIIKDAEDFFYQNLAHLTVDFIEMENAED